MPQYPFTHTSNIKLKLKTKKTGIKFAASFQQPGALRFSPQSCRLRATALSTRGRFILPSCKISYVTQFRSLVHYRAAKPQKREFYVTKAETAQREIRFFFPDYPVNSEPQIKQN
jgi:hypothetical protein